MISYKYILFVIILAAAIFIIPLAAAQNSCLDCHEKLTAFNETEQQFNKIRLKHLSSNVSVPCSLECHATTLNKIAKSNYEQWTRSKHSMFNVSCEKCHGGDPGSDVKEKAHIGVARDSDLNSTVFYRNVPETCGKCHQNELNEFKESKHYQRLKALKQAPTCDTCHMPHEFKVLNTSEFNNLCSQCHNIDMKIAPDVPDNAISALENADKLKNEIRLADSAIRQAKEKGKDVSAAQKDLESAISIRDSLPVLWHAFDLPSFGKVIGDGIDAAKKAQQESGMPAEKPSTPGFGAILSFTVITAIFLLLRRR